MKRRSNAPNAWIAKRLHMGVPQAVTVYIGRFEKEKKLSSPAYAAFVENFKSAGVWS